MNWKFSGAAIVTCSLFLFNAQRTAAQDTANLPLAVPIPAALFSGAAANIAPAERATIVVRVIDISGAPLPRQAVVQLSSTPGDAPLLVATESPAHATFSAFQRRKYTVKASAAGYNTAQVSLQTFANDSYYQAVLRLIPVRPRDQRALSSSAAESRGGPSDLSGIPSTPAPVMPQTDTRPERLANKTAPSWKPPSVDDETLQISHGIACPASYVLQSAQANVDAFVSNLNRFDATEHLLHQQLDSSGKVLDTQRRHFDYVVSIERMPSGQFELDESRDGADGYDDFPAGIATLGLPALALVFHEQYVPDYQFDCQGLGDWNGRATWLMHFRQRPGRVSRLRGYDVNGVLHPVPLQGRAWIAADSFQIMHMEADLMKPMPKIHLLYEHQAVDYAPVFFKTTRTEIWLPARASLYFDFRHHTYHRVHTFNSFKVFSVTATETIDPPKQVAMKTR